ncbi:MAG: hypothetical protein CFH33_01479 [Alphaproteobacteria bacterium MarineAlpha9_Bin3]|nr:MAG: hypothetical protein CFH33_01479 [Alphaproteobacteria bacterium MarineAlpha9_Bin3]|tara:strand:- start:2799 stop:3209 length:411 start_codon:yes stop_codon:yes gene_type:complete
MKVSIDVEEGALELMSKGKLDEPVIMLNLLKYLEKAKLGFGVDGLTGKEAYKVYGKEFAKFQPLYGGEPIWMGRSHNSIIGTDDWDIVILVRYPKRKNFIGMFQDPKYKAIAPIRAAALKDSRIIEMTQLLHKVTN